ncbi:MAG: family 20 glycosylhydrolase [Verrucomicrobia bacterium]|nr:family 20 glycosylhydrolase [Verrucomicrobiota bacterium]
MKPLLVPLLLAAALDLTLGADTALDQHFPVRGLSIAAPSSSQVERFARFIRQDLAPRGVNTLILRVDFNYQYESHPELRDGNALSRADVNQLVRAAQDHGIRIVPQINLLGHQSWANRVGNLLRVYPEFDETPWVQMPEKYAWPNPDGLYCKSYCPLHPKVHGIVFALVDELCDAFATDAFHAGMDEVFYLGDDKCPRCSGKSKAELFAGEVRRIRDHLATKNRQLWIWGDRLLDGKTTGLGEWEASLNHTHPAIDLIPKDVVICDWHYDRAEPTAAYFALKGFNVVTCPWKNPASAAQQVGDMLRFRTQPNPVLRDRARGIVQTVWSGAGSFLDSYERFTGSDKPNADEKSEAACFVRVFQEMRAITNP